MAFDEHDSAPNKTPCPDDTGIYRADEATRFKPGRSGNPGGRPKGARSKLSEAFLTALLEDFEEHGAETIAVVRRNDPATYVRVIAGLLPREVALDTTTRFESDEALDAEIDRLMVLLGYIMAKGDATS